MSFEDLKARIILLLQEATHQPEDLHEAQESLREHLSELETMGLTPPKDLVALERKLEGLLETRPR